MTRALLAVALLAIGCKTSAVKPVEAKAAAAVPASEIDPEGVARFVTSRKAEVERCFHRQLPENPLLSGTIVVLFTIQKSGRAAQIEIEQDTTQHPPLVGCLTTLIASWDFPFHPDEEVTFAYPFVFEAEQRPPRAP